MRPSDFIVNVSESDFEYQVLAYSQKMPVIVDFWAEWCIPCKLLTPILEKLVEEAQGEFRLAKVNVDQNPGLARQFNVHGIPAVKAFREGQVVAEFTGVQPEPRIREFIRSLLPGPSDLALEKGNSLLKNNHAQTAEQAFRDALEEEPENPPALLGLSKSLLLQGKVDEAKQILHAFPASAEYKTAETMRPLVDALASFQPEKLDEDLNDPLEAAYGHALRLVRRGNIPAALDGMLDVLRQDKRYRNGDVRRSVLGLIELINDEQLAREYRNELASILF